MRGWSFICRIGVSLSRAVLMIGLLILINVNGKISKFPLLGRYGKRRKDSPRSSRNAFISLEGLEDNYMRKTTTTKQNKQQQQNPLFFGFCSLSFLLFCLFVLNLEFLLSGGHKFNCFPIQLKISVGTSI